MITIIGAGIGGLTTAIALKQRGFEVEIFEAAPVFKKAGSGINLAINAMQIYKRLGIYDELLATGSHTNTMTVSDHQLKPISTIDLIASEKQHGVKTIAIHRSDLHEILLNHLQGISIHLHKNLDTLTQSGDQVNLSFKDGTTHQSNIVIGADGIHSAVRTSIFKDTKKRIAKQICWRGVVKTSIPKKHQQELNELWGKGQRFGFVHINKDEVYWFALANYKQNYRTEYAHVNIAELFANFNPLVTQIICATNKNDILTNEMMDLKPIPKWHHQNVCLLGDAAHATTPNMGQGACQAIESAYVLAKCISEEKTTEAAFIQFQKTRKTTATKIVNTSWTLGKVAHWENSIGILLRNKLMRLIPQSLTQKQAIDIYQLDY